MNEFKPSCNTLRSEGTQMTDGILIDCYGSSNEMRYGQLTVSPPGQGEVQIRQTAVGVNFLDTYHRRGVFPLPSLPGALGVEAAGEIVALGEGVNGLSVGQRIAYAAPLIGSYVGLRNLPAVHVLKVPAGIDDQVAAAVTLQGLTAHMLMTRVAPLRPGQAVLVHAAAGGLGSLLCQWARASGAQVIGSVGSAQKAERAKAMGCDEVILYKKESFVDAVRRITHGAGVDVVYEGLGGEVLQQSLQCLRPFGHLINLGQVGGGLPSLNIADLGPARSLTVSVPGIFAYLRTHPDKQLAADEVFGRVLSGALQVHIGGRFALRDAALAHQSLESGTTQGSLVLLPEVQ